MKLNLLMGTLLMLGSLAQARNFEKHDWAIQYYYSNAYMSEFGKPEITIRGSALVSDDDEFCELKINFQSYACQKSDNYLYVPASTLQQIIESHAEATGPSAPRTKEIVWAELEVKAKATSESNRLVLVTKLHSSNYSNQIHDPNSKYESVHKILIAKEVKR